LIQSSLGGRGVMHGSKAQDYVASLSDDFVS
jgi:hypothetical protein